MQSYPSPNTVGAEPGGPFYSSSSSQQQPGSSSADELRLQAQLSRGLMPIMNAGPGGGMSDSHDPRAHSNSHHHYELEHDQTHHSQHMQEGHGSMDMAGAHFASPEDSLSARKRSKVSRACDECRRKKIKCDATGEQGDENCSSCRRTGTMCQFSRVPMKRGPSKGYIKELADRLNSLEGAMQANDPHLQQQHYDGTLPRRSSEEFSPSPNLDSMSRKRTYSSVSGDFSAQPQRLGAWSPLQAPRHLSQPSLSYPQSTPAGQMFRNPDYSPSGLRPAPQWRSAPEPPRRQSNPFETMAGGDQSHSEHSSESDDSIIDSYYNIIHPIFPLLPQNILRVSARVSNCYVTLREAFYESLRAAARSFPSAHPPPLDHQGTRKATQLIVASQFENAANRTMSTNIVYLQIMMLMAIEAENNAPSSLRGQSGGSCSVWLGSAVGLAYSLKLHEHRKPERATENDPDSDDKLLRRIWWSLVIMDRWHASSTASPVLIPDSSVMVYPEDQALLGDSLYQLARLSIILGHCAEANLTPTDLPSLGVSPITVLSKALRGELERWRESLPASFFPPSNSPLVHICYWHIRIFMELNRPESDPFELLDAARNIVTQLTHNSSLVSPLTYQATALATLTLLELKNDDQTKEEAERGLQSLLEARIAPSSWDTTIRDMIATKHQHSSATAITSNPQTVESQHALVASQGLQHLADLAMATEESRDITSGESRKESEKSIAAVAAATAAAAAHLRRYPRLRHLVRSGYLSVFGGDPAGR